MARFKVVRGISYGPHDKYAPPGAVVDDLTAEMVAWMLADGVIEKVGNPVAAEKSQSRKVN